MQNDVDSKQIKLAVNNGDKPPHKIVDASYSLHGDDFAWLSSGLPITLRYRQGFAESLAKAAVESLGEKPCDIE